MFLDYVTHVRTLGSYRANEVAWVLTSKFYVPDGTRRAVLYVHGASATPAASPADHIMFNRAVLFALALAGYPVGVCDLGAPATYSYNTWGNDDSIDAITAAWNHLKSVHGAKTDKVGFLTSSMGATSLSWVRANLSSTFAALGTIPALDYNDIYVNDKTGPLMFDHRAAIATAYGVSEGDALPDRSTHNPVDFGAADLAGLPLKLYCASDDPLASTTAVATAWHGAGASKTVVDMGPVGHSESTLQDDDDVAAMVQFFDDNGGRS